MEETALEGLARVRDRQFSGNAAELARACNVNPNLVTRWFRGDRKPSWKNLAPMLETLGAKIIFESDGVANRPPTYSPSPFDFELRAYVTGLISIQRKNAESVAFVAAGGDRDAQVRISAFLQGKGPLWASDLVSISGVLGQNPEQVVKVVSEMVANAEHEVQIQQTLAG